MLATDAVKEIMQKTGQDNASLAKLMGKPTRMIIDRLGQKNISVSKLDEMLKVLGYKIVIMPAGAEVPEDGYEVD